MESGLWANYALTLSHAVAIPALRAARGPATRLCAAAVWASVAASVLMHLSETKHGRVPGHPRLRKYASLFLWADRGATVALAGAVAYALGASGGWRLLGLGDVLYAASGLVSLFLSERVFLTKEDRVMYVVAHAAWHGVAYGLVERWLKFAA